MSPWRDGISPFEELSATGTLGSTGASGAAFGLGLGAAAACEASVSITAIAAFTSTVSPSCARISTIVPLSGAGIYESTLSVEISRIVWSFST